MSNVGQNSVSSSPTFDSPILPTEESPSQTSTEDTNPTLSQSNVVIEDNVSNESNPSKLKSIVWEHFKKEKINNEWKETCNHCKKKFSGDSKNGTSHLRDHMRRCNKRGQLDIRQQVLVANQRKSDGKVTVKAASFNQDGARIELSKVIIMHEYPLSIVDHVQFRNYCFNLQPLFEMPSRRTIRRDIFNIYEEKKIKTMSMLECNEGRIAITTDMWTANHQIKGYMAITAHYIDHSWTLQKRILRFEYVPAPYTTDVIASTLMKCFLDWNIDRKLTSITVDNCTVNDSVKLQVKSELDRYLELELVPSTPNFDILNWWKINGPQFPILKDIARDVFAIPVSIVASESTFSTGGRLVSAQRNRLLPSMVEALTCSQNWLWAEEELNSNEVDFYEDGEIEQEESMDFGVYTRLKNLRSIRR
ncbi:hypothetical protein GQ457_14G016350 [Hibiscus cannabinus]